MKVVAETELLEPRQFLLKGLCTDIFKLTYFELHYWATRAI